MLTVGDILSEDICNNDEIVFKKGTVLNMNQIVKIQLLGYREVEVYDVPSLQLSNTSPSSPTSLEQEKIKRQFQNFLLSQNQKRRYTALINNEKDYSYLVDLFTSILSLHAVESILSSLNTWDWYSYEHSLDVFIIGSLWLKHLQMKNIEEIATGFLLHDIGKLHTPREILQKKGSLNFKEYENVQLHTTYGYDLLKKWRFADTICQIALLHHIGMDGSGYPTSNKNNQGVPFEVRLMTIVDVFSALTLDRPYRKAYALEQALKIIKNEQDKFDLDLLHDFFKRLKTTFRNSH